MKFFCGYKRCYHRTSFPSLYELIEHLRVKHHPNKGEFRSITEKLMQQSHERKL